MMKMSVGTFTAALVISVVVVGTMMSVVAKMKMMVVVDLLPARVRPMVGAV
jgi:hypothetical protein